MPDFNVPILSDEEADELSDEFKERSGCIEVAPALLELHEVLEWKAATE